MIYGRAYGDTMMVRVMKQRAFDLSNEIKQLIRVRNRR